MTSPIPKSVTPASPVAAMCTDARSPSKPSSSTSAPISTYQNTPSPSRLMTENSRRTRRRRQ